MKYTFLFSICLILTACDKEAHSGLDRAEKLMTTYSDSSLMILEDIKSEYSFMTEANKANFGYLYTRAQDLQNLFVYDSQLEFSIDYFRRTKQNSRLAYCYFYKGHTSFLQRDYPLATENILKAKDLISANDTVLSARIFFELGRISSFQLHYEESIEYYKEAIVNLEKLNKTSDIARIHLAMTEIYMCLEKYDKAIGIGKLALEKYSPDSITVGDLYNSIGAIYYTDNNFDSAIYYINKSLDYPFLGTNMSMRYYYMGQTHYSLNNCDSAEYYLNKALEYRVDIYYEEMIYTSLTEIAVEKKEVEKIKPYMAKMKLCQDSLYKLEQKTDIKIVQQIHESNKLADEIKNQRLILFASAIFLFLIGITIISLLYKRAKHKQLAAEKYKTKMKEKQELLVKKNEQLERTRELEIGEINRKLQNARTKYAKERKKADVEQKEKITRMIYSEVLNFENEEVFFEKMNQILNNLPGKLQKKYSNITFKEIVWCCLFILQVPTPDILIILGYKQSSLYKFKQRLGNKLGFTAMKDLEQMLYQEIDS